MEGQAIRRVYTRFIQAKGLRFYQESDDGKVTLTILDKFQVTHVVDPGGCYLKRAPSGIFYECCSYRAKFSFTNTIKWEDSLLAILKKIFPGIPQIDLNFLKLKFNVYNGVYSYDYDVCCDCTGRIAFVEHPSGSLTVEPSPPMFVENLQVIPQIPLEGPTRCQIGKPYDNSPLPPKQE